MQQKILLEHIQNIWISEFSLKAAFWKRLPILRPADYSPKTVESIVVALERDAIVQWEQWSVN